MRDMVGRVHRSRCAPSLPQAASNLARTVRAMRMKSASLAHPNMIDCMMTTLFCTHAALALLLAATTARAGAKARRQLTQARS